MLLCTVRNCAQPLARDERRYVCPRNHSFDIAASRYVNLLQPQDRRSAQPGDSAEAVEARRRLHATGVTAPLATAIRDLATPWLTTNMLDVGCGDGFYLKALTAGTEVQGSGVDISLPAIQSAARHYPACEWVVANADRFIPWSDSAFHLITSITARMNAAEFHRVLKPEGRLLVAIPAPDDLIELRGHGKDRIESTTQTFAEHFSLAMSSRVTTHAHLDPATIEGIRKMIYRPYAREAAAPESLTFSLDLLLFEPRPQPVVG